MRIAILGGTQFIGRAITERLANEGHQLLLVHRGEHEPPGLPEAEHAHADRPLGSPWRSFRSLELQGKRWQISWARP
jgi:nucleoside-diphosphate-sugar epimerase